MMQPIAIVSGAIANKFRNGGEPWIRLSWVLGLKRLGFDVCFVEQISRAQCVDANGVETSFEASVNLAWFRDVMQQFGLTDSCALLYENGEKTSGLKFPELLRLAASAELLVNISGHLTCEAVKGLPRCKVYIDEDPGFTQIWRANGMAVAGFEGHDFHFTLGANIGSADCAIPTGDIGWRHTRPHVILNEWPVSSNDPEALDCFTTIASWRGAYGPVQYGGKTYGLKVHEFRKFIDLPRRSRRNFEIALQIHPNDKKDLEALVAHDWRIVDPKQAADSPNSFRRYVQTSRAEFSVAQGVYVDTNSGWFSDRTVRYLASGKPALVQDTGFSRHYPVGQGLLAFRTLEEAIEGAERIVCDYEMHCRAARRLAEEYFESDKVIGRLAEEIGIDLPQAQSPEPQVERNDLNGRGR